ncbi:MAG: outer membrane protein [Chlamydiales bacterium]
MYCAFVAYTKYKAKKSNLLPNTSILRNKMKKSQIRKFITIVVALLSFGVFQSAFAKGYRPTEDSNLQVIPSQAQEKKDWSASIGFGTLLKPKYEGSSKYEMMPVPFFDIKYKDLLSINPFRGLRLNTIHTKKITAGIGVRPNFGRKENDADILNGLGDIDPSAEGLLFASYKHNSFSTSITCAQGLNSSGHDGFTAKLSASYFKRFHKYKLIMIPSISTLFANTKYMSSFFGIDPNQSNNSGLNQFEARSGLKDISASLATSYDLTGKWSLNGLITGKRLIGDSAKSPIVKKKNAFSLAFYAGYNF